MTTRFKEERPNWA